MCDSHATTSTVFCSVLIRRCKCIDQISITREQLSTNAMIPMNRERRICRFATLLDIDRFLYTLKVSTVAKQRLFACLVDKDSVIYLLQAISFIDPRPVDRIWFVLLCIVVVYKSIISRLSRVKTLLNNYIAQNEQLWWLSTLGGAYSSLGQYTQQCVCVHNTSLYIILMDRHKRQHEYH
jgi:hypothetical protein